MEPQQLELPMTRRCRPNETVWVFFENEGRPYRAQGKVQAIKSDTIIAVQVGAITHPLCQHAENKAKIAWCHEDELGRFGAGIPETSAEMPVDDATRAASAQAAAMADRAAWEAKALAAGKDVVGSGVLDEQGDVPAPPPENEGSASTFADPPPPIPRRMSGRRGNERV